MRGCVLLVLLGIVLVPGCSDLVNWFDQIGSIFGEETDSPELKRFESEGEFVEYFSAQVVARNDGIAAPGDTGDLFGGVEALDDRADAAPTLPGVGADGPGGALTDDDSPLAPSPGEPEGTDSDGEFSETTTQEAGVDEADVVKTDGTYIYVIDGGTLRIAQVSPPEQLAVLSTVPVEGYGREIYLYESKVIAITTTSGGYIFSGGGVPIVEDLSADQTVTNDAIAVDAEPDRVDTGAPDPGFEVEVIFSRPQTIVTIIDASTPSDPEIISQTEFDGSQSSSRMIDGVLHLVVANYQNYYFDVLPRLGTPELAISDVDTAQLLPEFEHTASDGTVTTGSLLTWQELYRPTDPDGFGVVTVVSMDVNNSSVLNAVGIVAEPGLIYSSREALYLTDTNYDFFGEARETTDIYKFAYVEGGTEAVATGTVPGRVLNQYSMGEHAGHLRVATTVGPTFAMFGERVGPFNNVYVLAQTDTSLTVAGSIEGIAPGERIQSARFIGDRGFLVTFREVDPLFTLDLADPNDPRIVGELKVPGFSTFIVPMDDDHLLTVGQYIPESGMFFGRGVQLSIFDITDFANPTLQHNVIVGGEESQASSEALHNPKAFTYFVRSGANGGGDMIALPISVSDFGGFFFDDVVAVEVDDVGMTEPDALPPSDTPPPPPLDEPAEPPISQGFDGLVVYGVSAEDGFTELGRISTRFEDAGYNYGGSFTRGVFINDDVFAVTNIGVRGAPIDDVDSAAYELLLAQPADADLPGAGSGGLSSSDSGATEPAREPEPVAD